MVVFHKMIACGKDKGLKYGVTAFYDIKNEILRAEIKLTILLRSRLFSFEAQAVYCY